MCAACSPSTGTVGKQFAVANSWRDDTGAYRILVDLDTRVQYLWYKDEAIYGQCITVMVDEDGVPIVYEGMLDFGVNN